MKLTESNCQHGFSLFIEEFRKFVIFLLAKEFGNNWAQQFRDSLYPEQKSHWDLDIANKLLPENLIDFQYLKYFSIKFKWLLKPIFDTRVNNLPTWFDDIYHVRKHLAHYNFRLLTEDEITIAWARMISISQILQMDELKEKLIRIQTRKKSVKKLAKQESKKLHTNIIQHQLSEDPNTQKLITRNRRSTPEELEYYELLNKLTEHKKKLVSLKSEKENVEKAIALEKKKEAEKSSTVTITDKGKEIKPKSRVFKRITRNLITDFNMIDNLRWIKIENNKILIDNLVFDFEKTMIYEKRLIGFSPKVNYEEIIKKFLINNRRISIPDYNDHKDINPYSTYESYQNEIKRLNSWGTDFEINRREFLKFSLNNLDFSKFEMAFEIGDQETKHKFSLIIFERLDKSQMKNIYLFYSYIISYICRNMNVNLLINRFQLNKIDSGLDFNINVIITIYDFFLSDVYLGLDSRSDRSKRLKNIE